MFACGKWLLLCKSPGGSLPRPYGEDVWGCSHILFILPHPLPYCNKLPRKNPGEFFRHYAPNSSRASLKAP